MSVNLKNTQFVCKKHASSCVYETEYRIDPTNKRPYSEKKNLFYWEVTQKQGRPLLDKQKLSLPALTTFLVSKIFRSLYYTCSQLLENEINASLPSPPNITYVR